MTSTGNVKPQIIKEQNFCFCNDHSLISLKTWYFIKTSHIDRWTTLYLAYTNVTSFEDLEYYIMKHKLQEHFAHDNRIFTKTHCIYFEKFRTCWFQFWQQYTLWIFLIRKNYDDF